jgi:hypothetical protein
VGSGEMKIAKLRIREDALKSLQLPIRLKSGWVSNLHMLIPMVDINSRVGQPLQVTHPAVEHHPGLGVQVLPSCHAVPCGAVPCRAVPCRAVPCRAVPCRAVWRAATIPSHPIPSQPLPDPTQIRRDPTRIFTIPCLGLPPTGDRRGGIPSDWAH